MAKAERVHTYKLRILHRKESLNSLSLASSCFLQLKEEGAIVADNHALFGAGLVRLFVSQTGGETCLN